MANYYVVIGSNNMSEVVKAQNPAMACHNYYPGYSTAAWHIRQGRAPCHYIGYQFTSTGRLNGRVVNLVDLGSAEGRAVPRWRPSSTLGMLEERKERSGAAYYTAPN